MKRLFILFVLVHLLIDLAAPSLPGAFRFNPDESVVGVKVQTVQPHDFKPPLQANPGREFLDLPRLAMKSPVEPQRWASAPDLIALLPRRDPSSDRSLQGSSEDH
jgi:hypothetical protein